VYFLLDEEGRLWLPKGRNARIDLLNFEEIQSSKDVLTELLMTSTKLRIVGF
jgi:hypothetical protein